MSQQITKSQIKRAWEEIDRWGKDVKSTEKNRLLTAATALALAEYAAQLEWIQEPPPHTVLEIVDSRVLLSYDPNPSVWIKAQLEESEKRNAEQILEKNEHLIKPLQCLGLQALEGDLRWRSDLPRLL